MKLNEAQKAELIAAREMDWQALLAETPEYFQMNETHQRLLRCMFDSGWLLGTKRGLKIAQEIMREHHVPDRSASK